MSDTRTHHTLSADALTLAYDRVEVARNLSVTIPTGRITCIVGANACGKSTLLRALARLLKPKSGTVLLDGESIHRLPTKVVATRLGILPQSPIAPEGITVADLVARGRYPHQKWFRQWTRADEAVITDAMEATGTIDIATRPVDELSGGQRQRVWIAMALAQGTDLMLLDEPTTFLDLAHQVEVLDLLVDLNRREQRTIVLVLHDLNHARATATTSSPCMPVGWSRMVHRRRSSPRHSSKRCSDFVVEWSSTRCRARRWCCRSGATATSRTSLNRARSWGADVSRNGHGECPIE
jgi:iron complex transport system ATP-binding protein